MTHPSERRTPAVLPPGRYLAKYFRAECRRGSGQDVRVAAITRDLPRVTWVFGPLQSPDQAVTTLTVEDPADPAHLRFSQLRAGNGEKLRGDRRVGIQDQDDVVIVHARQDLGQRLVKCPRFLARVVLCRHDSGTMLFGHESGAVGAVVRDHENVVRRELLSSDGLKRRGDAGFFVVGWN